MSPVAGRTFGTRGIFLTPDEPNADQESSDLLDDLRLFATGWLGGLVFFGTLIA